MLSVLKCPNIYGIHMHAYTYMRQYIEPVITLCMPVDNFVDCQYLFANSLNPDEDQQNVSLDLDPNCLTLWWLSWVVYLKKN